MNLPKLIEQIESKLEHNGVRGAGKRLTELAGYAGELEALAYLNAMLITAERHVVELQHEIAKVERAHMGRTQKVAE